MKLLFLLFISIILQGTVASGVFMIWLGYKRQPDSHIKVHQEYIEIYDVEGKGEVIVLTFKEIDDIGDMEQRFVRDSQYTYYKAFTIYCDEIKVTIAGFSECRTFLLRDNIFKEYKNIRTRRRKVSSMDDKEFNDLLKIWYPSEEDLLGIEMNSLFSDDTENDLNSETLPIINNREGRTCNLM